MGICDKIVPGLLIGALAFGHLPALFVPAGPMPAGIPNKKKAEVRERYAAGEATREELLEVEAQSYHAAGTCTFYGTANSNKVLLEAMGVQLPGSSFINPGTPLRTALDEEAVRRVLRMSALGDDYRPLGQLIDERAIVNAVVALMATGGSTNHTIHWIAVARAAGVVLTWDDMDQISQAVPLLARVYPNGEADVNRFQAAGGVPFVFRELLDAGLMHDLRTVVPEGMRAFTREPRLDNGTLASAPAVAVSADDSVVRTAAAPFEAQGVACACSAATSAVADQAVGGQARAPLRRGAGGGGRRAAEAQQAACRRRAAEGFRRGGDLLGSARQRHAGTALAGAAAGHAAEPGPQGRAGHRRPPLRRLRQDPRGDPRHP